MPGDVYKGRSISGWLADLAGGSEAANQEAGEALFMYVQQCRIKDRTHGADTPPSFAAAVRSALGEPEVAADALLPSLARRLTAGFRAMEERLEENGRGADLRLGDMGAVEVLQAAGPAWLPALDSLLEVLADPEPILRDAAFRAVGSIGPAARPALSRLLTEVERYPLGRPYWLGRAVAQVAADDQGAVDEILRLLDPDRSPAAVQGGLEILREMGRRASPAVPAVIELSRRLPEHRLRAAAVLGGIAPEGDSEPAIDRLVELVSDPEPEIRAAALTALGEIRRRPDLSIPALRGRVGDYGQGGASPHDAAVASLGKFGEEAAAAVPDLATRLVRPHGGVDYGVVEALGRIGPGARQVIPELEKLPEEHGRVGVLSIALKRIREE